MISLASEITDRKNRRARAWLFYDADCRFCTRIAAQLARPLARRGVGMAPLQDPRVGVLLGLSRQELLRALRFVSGNDRHYSGAEACIEVARELWWAQPLVWLAKIPGMMGILSAAYEQVARQRSCTAQQCKMEHGKNR